MSNGAGKPKPAFFAAIAVIVLGLVGFAVYRMTAKKKDDPSGSGSGSQFTDPRKPAGSGAAKPGTAENPDPNAPPLTETKYEWEPVQRLPEVKGTDSYKALGTPRVVRFAINVWAGWAPIVWANQGPEPKKKWKDAKGGEFQVELVLIDDPVEMRDTVAAGKVHIGWATVDMLPLLVQGLKKDSRTMPRVYQQIDWSNGGDGIVARDEIKGVGGLRGKTVVLAQNSPSHYFLMNMLLNAGVGLKDVTIRPVKNAFQAATAFNADKSIAAAVSWAPDIYKLTEKNTGNKMLVSTVEANKLIADVWFARADFGQANPDIIEGLVRGIFDAVEELKTDQNKDSVAAMMEKFYNLKAGTGKAMLGDAHWTNYAENRDFFLVGSNPTNFERTYDTAYLLYNESKMIDDKVNFDKIVDFSIIKKLGGEDKYASQKNTYEFKFTPASAESLNAEKNEILNKTVVIKFFPNSNDLFHKVPGPSGGVVLYDGNVEFTIEQIAKLAGTFGAARIVIEGHTDSSMKNAGGDEALVKTLSLRRANAVKEALVNRFKMNQNQFSTAGYGWERPADPNEPNNHAKNRRVEVKVVPAEAQ